MQHHYDQNSFLIILPQAYPVPVLVGLEEAVVVEVVPLILRLKPIMDQLALFPIP
jgi:hypothetical protein